MLEDKVKKAIKEYNLISEEDKVLVAVSGGPDSITLLNILYKFGYNICTAHVNHGIRDNAKNDEEFVKKFCEERNIPFFVKSVKLMDMDPNGMTIEELGRKVRYDFFYEVMEKESCTKIATAHNANDNAETVMMNIIRGTGLAGLKGIGAKRDNLVVRPLINVTRKEIEEYCEKENLNPCHDETNDEVIYTRNKIRLELLPYIEKNINTNVISNINRMSEILSEDETFIQRIVNEKFEECLVAEEDGRVVCNLKKFNKCDDVIKKRLIVKFIIKTIGNAKDIERVHIEDILKLCEKNIGKKYLTPNKNIKVFVDKGKVEYTRIL